MEGGIDVGDESMAWKAASMWAMTASSQLAKSKVSECQLFYMCINLYFTTNIIIY